MLEALVKYRVRAVRCSIDGASPETYRVYRVRGDFDLVIGNIRRVNHYKRQYQSILLAFSGNSLYSAHNEHEMPLRADGDEFLGMEFNTRWLGSRLFTGTRQGLRARADGTDATARAEHEQIYGEKYFSQICRQLSDDP